MTLSEQDTFLDFDNMDLREQEDPLSGIDKKKYNRIKKLKFEYCQINPHIVGTVLTKLKNVKTLDLVYCNSYESPEDSVPELKRKLTHLTVGLDLNEEEEGYLDCSSILLHRKLELSCAHLTVDRYERPMIICGGDIGDNYWKWFDPAVEYRTYLTKYIDRFQDDIKYILFDSGRPKIWKRLTKANDIRNIRFGVCRDLDVRGM